jgi:hypothetical protein
LGADGFVRLVEMTEPVGGLADPYANPFAAEPLGVAPRSRGQALLRGLGAIFVVAVALTLTGVPAGFLWNAVAPHAQGEVVEDGVDLVDPVTKAFIGADVVFMIIMAAIGLVAGVLAWRLGRRNGPAISIGLVLGGLAAAFIAWKVGWSSTHDAVLHWAHTAPVGARRDLFVDLGAKAGLVVMALAALLAQLTMVALFEERSRSPLADRGDLP